MDFLHISDLHFSPQNPFQAELISQLWVDLKRMLESGRQPDLVIFSGDLVNNPDDPDVYQKLESEFLVPLLSILKLDNSMVALCPGNHDVSWAEMKSNKLAYDSVQNYLNDLEFLAGALQNGEFQNYAKNISREFFDLATRYGGAWDNPFFKVYDFDELKMSIVALNSAFGCSLDGSSHDRGRLAISPHLALTAFQSVPNGYSRISVSHHTFSDMSEAVTRELVTMVERHAIAHCFGHVHQAKPSTITSVSGNCLHIQSGALYEKQGVYNGYLLCRGDESRSHIEATYRTYYLDRREFDEGTNVSQGGRFYNAPESQAYWLNRIVSPSNAAVVDLLESSSEKFCSELQETMIDKPLSDVFIEPRLVSPNASDDDSAIGEKSYSLSALLKSDDHFVIGADKEYGATSLLRFLMIELFQNCKNYDKARVPIMLDARRFQRRPYKALIERLVKSRLPDTNNDSLKLEALHDSRRLVIIIDDVDPGDDLQIETIKQIVFQYPKAKLIVAAKIPNLPGDHVMPVVGIESFVFIQIKSLNRNRVRKLVQTWGELQGMTIDQTVEEIISKFGALGIPLTPAYIAIYLSILAEDKSFSPVNTSNVIEAFIEQVLEKYKPEYRFRSSFDYRAQVSYLGFIAEKMCRENKFEVPYENLYEWTKSYFDGIGIEQNFTQLIEYFINNKIFDSIGNDIAFRYRIFVSFFVASQLRLSSDFREWLFSEKIFMRYINEIDIYCGLTRNDVETLEFLSGEFRKYSKEVEDLVAPLAWPDRLENLQIPTTDKSEKDFTDSITEQLNKPNMEASERDDILDKEDRPAATKPEISRREFDGVLENWVTSLRCYTVALKNLEEIPKERKEKHLTEVLEGWANLLRYACLLFEQLMKDKEFSVGHMKFRLVMPEKMRVPFLRMLLLHIPLVVSHILRNDLGSQKLSLQLRNQDLVHTATTAFLQTGLYADLKLSEYINQLKKLHSRVSGSKFFLEALLMKMRDIYLRFNIDPLEVKAFRELVAEVSADAKGLKGRERNDHVNKYLSDLRKKEHVQKLKSQL